MMTVNCQEPITHNPEQLMLLEKTGSEETQETASPMSSSSSADKLEEMRNSLATLTSHTRSRLRQLEQKFASPQARNSSNTNQSSSLPPKTAVNNNHQQGIPSVAAENRSPTCEYWESYLESVPTISTTSSSSSSPSPSSSMSNSPQSVWSTPPKVAPSPSEDHSTLKKYSPDSHASVLLKEVLKEDYDEETKAFQDEEEEEAEESSNNTDHVSYKFSPTLPSSTVETEISLVVPTQGGTNPMELPLATEDNPTSPQKAKDIPSVLLRVPNTAFGIPMGLAGNAYMWKMVENATFLPVQTSLACTILWFASFIVGVIISFLYIYKVFWNFHMVVQEYQHPSRNPFFHGPLLTFLLLSLGIPPAIHVSSLCLQILFGIGLLFQSVTTLITMKKSLSHAKPQFVLSILGWFLLSLLGQQANASEIWGIDLPTFCLGIGGIQFIMVFGNVWNGWHRHNSPALLLLLAPPSVAVLAVNGYGENDEFSLTSLAILGWAIGFAIFLMRYARSLTKNSSELGTYFAYVYPLAALSSAILQYSLVEQTMATKILATISMTLATIAILCVFFRMIYQMVLCFYYKSHWGDPLLGIVPSNRKRNVVTERQEQP